MTTDQRPDKPAVMEAWIETIGGRIFHYLGDDTDGIAIDDIAGALSKCCRYTGHCNKFYSVAEHSFFVSLHVPREFALEGLLHDASEAYLSDIASPVKQLMPEYKAIEDKIMARIAKKFNLEADFHKSPDVKEADWAMLMTEARFLLPSRGEKWFFPEGQKPSIYRPVCWSPDAAAIMFMQRFWELTHGV
jgi:hypothetical protein